MNMDTWLAGMLHEWRDFYALVGAASATLVGLLFVAASIGANTFTEQHRAPLQAFLTPTLAHFSAVMFASMLAIAPLRDERSLAGLLGALALAGLAYSATIFVRLVIERRFKADLTDRVFYALIPTLGYLMLLAAAALFFVRSATSADMLAAALLSLLVAGVRNAWDITMFVAIHSPTSGGPPP